MNDKDTNTDTDIFKNRWNWLAIGICHLAVVILLTGWVWRPTQALWNRIDMSLFYAINHPLASGGPIAYFWAIANSRFFDLVIALFMLVVMVWPKAFLPKGQILRGLIGFAGILLFMYLMRKQLHHIVRFVGWQTGSPSVKFDNAVLLSDHFHVWRIKDHSNDSFPGDHAGVLMVWGLFLSAYARRWKYLFVWGAVALFSLPRLVAGAHSLSDDVVGGGSIALITIAWSFYTPYVFRFSNAVQRLLYPIYWLLGKVFPRLNQGNTS